MFGSSGYECGRSQEEDAGDNATEEKLREAEKHAGGKGILFTRAKPLIDQEVVEGEPEGAQDGEDCKEILQEDNMRRLGEGGVCGFYYEGYSNVTYQPRNHEYDLRDNGCPDKQFCHN